MKAKSHALLVALADAQRQERAAASKLASQNQYLIEQRQHLARLQSQQDDCQRRVHSKDQSQSAVWLRESVLFLTKLEQSIADQHHCIDIDTAKVGQLTARWREKQAKVKALETLLFKLQLQSERIREADEQDIADEVGLRRYYVAEEAIE